MRYFQKYLLPNFQHLLQLLKDEKQDLFIENTWTQYVYKVTWLKEKIVVLSVVGKI